ncbi:hypothetical protein GDO81_003372 [Engystomops pustulosus]|uniref:Uncharacterized protein n=1 Tax=Engystomops pustulosus TaxID=76066 RepID=A0AAV6ZW09_ENGPU|nr:hypothetical protein GDO81_003372 [Engystomops pustulosus]
MCSPAPPATGGRSEKCLPPFFVDMPMAADDLPTVSASGCPISAVPECTSVDPPAATECVPALSIPAIAHVPTTCGLATATAAPDDIPAASAPTSAVPVSTTRGVQATGPNTAASTQADDVHVAVPAPRPAAIVPPRPTLPAFLKIT